MATIKSGTVKYPANKAFPDQYNQGKFKQNVVLTMSDGSEETLWFSQGRVPHSTLPKGATVQLLFEERDGKMTRKLIDNSQSTPTTQTSQAKTTTTLLSPERKREIMEYLNQQSDLLAFCWDTALGKFQHKVQSEESLRDLATTLYLSAKDKFNL